MLCRFCKFPYRGELAKRNGKAKTAALSRPLQSADAPRKTRRGRKAKSAKGKTEMDNEKFECWIDVPETDGRIQFSNLGRLRVRGKKRRRCSKTEVMFVNELKPVVCDYKTSRLGWWVNFDMGKRFFPRDELAGLFPASVLDIDKSPDAAAREFRDKTFRDLEAERQRGAEEKPTARATERGR